MEAYRTLTFKLVTALPTLPPQRRSTLVVLATLIRAARSNFHESIFHHLALHLIGGLDNTADMNMQRLGRGMIACNYCDTVNILNPRLYLCANCMDTNLYLRNKFQTCIISCGDNQTFQCEYGTYSYIILIVI